MTSRHVDEGPKTALDTIHRLCALLYEVHDQRFDWSEGPCDCFCPDRKSDPKNWRSTGDALRFVERVVRNALASEARPSRIDAALDAIKTEYPATSQAEEPWEFDGDCTRCNATMAWEGDMPESPENALCCLCLETKVHELRTENRELKAGVEAWQRAEAAVDGGGGSARAAAWSSAHPVPGASGGGETVHSFAGVDPRSAEGQLRSVLWEILGGLGAESVEDAARRIARERNEARALAETWQMNDAEYERMYREAKAALASLRPYFGELAPQRDPVTKHERSGYYDAARAAFALLGRPA